MTTVIRPLLVAALSVISCSSAGALEGQGRALAVSNTLRLSADATRSGLVVSKQFIVPYAGVIRLRYQFKSDGNGPQTVSVSVATAAENSVPDCSASTTATTFQTKVCDLRVVAGDRVTVFGSGMLNIDPFDPGQSTVFLRNVRLFWNIIDSTGTGTVLLD